MSDEAVMIHASTCKCIKCGEQAVAFWPIVDLDLPRNPYCRSCLDAEKIKMMVELNEMGLI